MKYSLYMALVWNDMSASKWHNFRICFPCKPLDHVLRFLQASQVTLFFLFCLLATSLYTVLHRNPIVNDPWNPSLSQCRCLYHASMCVNESRCISWLPPLIPWYSIGVILPHRCFFAGTVTVCFCAIWGRNLEAVGCAVECSHSSVCHSYLSCTLTAWLVVTIATAVTQGVKGCPMGQSLRVNWQRRECTDCGKGYLMWNFCQLANLFWTPLLPHTEILY